MARRLLFKLLPALMLATLAGCGYSLRGSGSGAFGHADLRLLLSESEPAFERLLRRNLASAGVNLHRAADERAGGHPLLAVGPEQFSGRPASTTAQARAAQITLQLAVRVNFTDGENVLIDGETLRVERTYYQDLRNIAGNRGEAELLREEMRRDLVAQLLRRIEASGR